MKSVFITSLTVLCGSILLCNPAEGIKNPTMSPHHGNYKEDEKKDPAQTPHTSSSTSATKTSSLSERDQRIWDSVVALSQLSPEEIQKLIKQYSSVPENEKKSTQQDITKKKVDYMHKITNTTSTQEEKSDASRLKAIENLKEFVLKGKYPK